MRKIIFLAIIIPFAFGACQIFNPVPPTPTPFPPTPTPLPPKELNICLGYEPESLYPYAAASQAARNVMQAIYDGPIDTVNDQPVAVILEKLPNFTDGSARFTPVGVNPGDTVVNSAGYLVSLQAGVEVFPSGCSSPSCVITYDGASPLQLDQITAVFKLKPGLKWADGQPLTAADSVYSFLVASDPLTPVSKQTVDQTASYATT
ncbi:MAG TPA: ABC transporter substrate-binding protein, partial [Pelolinea sp.]|nr:ABC transporter substrate-binding protein [Pelolinea sp.]